MFCVVLCVRVKEREREREEDDDGGPFRVDSDFNVIVDNLNRPRGTIVHL